MRQLLLILILVCSLAPARSQWDTAAASSPWVPLAGTALVATGTVFSLTPALHEYSISLHNSVQSDGHAKLHFDDYCQFLPIAVPFVLNMAGVKGRHSLDRLVVLSASSYMMGMAFVETVKYSLHVVRPDGRGFTSFPSGHTYFAFNGAEILRREYGADYPWLAIAGYLVAVAIGVMRVYNDRHWASDVVAGAGVGILSASFAYWMLD